MGPKREVASGTAKIAVCLRIPKKTGEMALRLLVDNQLLDRQVKVRSDGETLLLPLVRKPDDQELKRLEDQLGSLSLSREHFPVRPKHPQTMEESLSQLLPPSILASLPSSLDVVGDIAILELPPELVPYENTVANAAMTIHKNVRVVLAKAGPVSGSHRVRPYRRIAGEDRTETIHKEFGCRFKVDLSKAFFSPRLSNEHQRIAQTVQPGERVVDLFAGVGPFSIFIAKRVGDVEVDAVDANPEAARLLEENIRLNNPKGRITVWLGDARDIVEQHLAGKAARVIMNYPSEGKDFVDVACRAMQPRGGVLHYYTFAEGIDSESKAVVELEEALTGSGWKVERLIEARRVRGIAPMRWQVVVDARIVPSLEPKSRL